MEGCKFDGADLSGLIISVSGSSALVNNLDFIAGSLQAINDIGKAIEDSDEWELGHLEQKGARHLRRVQRKGTLKREGEKRKRIIPVPFSPAK